MTEAEWLACSDPIRMLELLGNKCSKRKMRLFVADGVQSLESIFGTEQKVLAEMHERVAEGQATEEDLERFLLRDMPELWEHRAPGGNLPSVWQSARMGVRERFKLAPLEKSELVTDASRAAEYAEMCIILRCIFGNPFRPMPLPSSLFVQNDVTLVTLAQAIYQDRGFDRLPILADVLEEAGCTDVAILDHCRHPGPHVRGCWVVDLILGKS